MILSPPPPPPLSINFFDTRNFVKQRRVPLRSFSVLWDNKFSIENRDIPLWGIKFFNTPNFLKHWRDAHEIFRYCETRIFRRKNVISPLLSINFFRYQKISGKQKGSFTKLSVSVLWDENFSTKPWSFPPPLLETFWYQNSFETQKGSPTNFIGTLRQKFFNGVYWYPLFMHKILRCTKFSETQKCSLTKFFGTVWQKVFDEETWYPPPSDA